MKGLKANYSNDSWFLDNDPLIKVDRPSADIAMKMEAEQLSLIIEDGDTLRVESLHAPRDELLDTAHALLSQPASALELEHAVVLGVVAGYLGTEREDVVATVHEAERQLLIATRAIRRAIKTLER